MDRKYEQLTITNAFIFSKVMRNCKLAKRLLEPLLGCKIKTIICTSKNIIGEDDEQKGICLEVHTFEGKCKVIILHLFLCTKDIFGAGRSVYRFEELCKEEPQITLPHGVMKIFVCATSEAAAKESNEDIQALLYYLLDSGERRNNVIKMLNDEVHRVRGNSLYKKDYYRHVQEETEASQRRYAQSLLAERK